jgi:crotonobetainyl-CoA:carnitine CoA-transferase CaiB-like acyl-CoA transferase
VPCSRYRTVAEALDDPISKARGVLGTVEDAAGSFGAPNPPFRMSQSRAEVGRKIPALGEANAEMLRWPKSTR